MEKRTRCAIIGFASSSRDQAPYNDQSFEIWSLNHAYHHVPRWDRWWEIHDKSHFEKDLMRDGQMQDGKRHVDWLAKEPADARPIYCQEHYDNIPASVRWPRQEINEWFRKSGGLGPDDLPQGFYADDYFTSTPGEMLAHAIWEGFQEIHLYGIDMLQQEEYGVQRPGCEYYVGFARGRGIKVYVPQASALCKANYVYGYSEPPTDVQHLQPYLDYLTAKASESELNKAKAAGAAQTIDGGLQMVRILLQLMNEGATQRSAEDNSPVLGPDSKPLKRPATLEDIKKECEQQVAQLEPKQREALNTIIAMDGQMAGFKCSASWAEHYGRGGRLE